MDFGDNSAGNTMAKFIEFAFGRSIPPRPIIRSEAYNKLANFLYHPRAARFSCIASIILIGNQIAMPPHNRVGGENGADLREYFVAECFARCRQSPASLIGKQDSLATNLISKDSVLLLELIDYSLLLFIEDAGNDKAERCRG